MNIFKWLVIVIAATATGLGVAQWRRAQETERARQAAASAMEQTRQKIAGLESHLAAEKKRTADVESDNAALRQAVEKTKLAKAKAAKPAVTRAAAETMAKEALALARDGDSDEALQALLKCYDLNVTQRNIFSSGQMTGIVGALAKMSAMRADAAAALRERLDQARQRVLADPEDTDPLQEIAMIGRALKDDSIILSLYDALPVEDVRRKRVAIYATGALLEAQRYREVVEATPFTMMSSMFELNINNGMAKRPSSTYLVTTTAKNIEALAGAGDLEHARDLAKRLLLFDGSDETRAMLQSRLTRAGQPDLLK